MLVLIFSLIQLCIAGLFFFMCLSFLTGAPFVPSNKKASAAMIALARIRPGMMIYDLGSGDGRLLFAAAALGAKTKGWDINPYLVVFTKIKALFSKTRNHISVYWGNYWNVSLHDADIIYIYLLPWKMDALARKIQQEAKPNALIVSNSFIFPKWKILRQDEENHIYVFQIPK